MNIKIKKKWAEAVGFDKVGPFFDKDGTRFEDAFRWKEVQEIDLFTLDIKRVQMLRQIVVAARDAKIRDSGVMLQDIDMFMAAKAGNADKGVARSVDQFTTLVGLYIFKHERRHVYKQESDGTWLPYYVSNIEYHPPRDDRDGYHPPYMTMDLVYIELGEESAITIVFQVDDCVQHTAALGLASKNIVLETPERRESYLAERARYNQIFPQVGKQFWAEGEAYDDLDGNPQQKSGSWWGKQTRTINMVRAGSPTRVVVDVAQELDDSDDRRRRRGRSWSKWFWVGWENKVKKARAQDEHEIFANDVAPDIEIPIHPFIPIFDLSKHLRCRIHVSNLTEYVYDKTIADKLILDPRVKDLVSVLVEHREGGFKDIIRNKSGGAVVLLAGPPGVGKTLTAEVYAESTERALYSVQCAQLGVDPAELEDELMKVFARAKRWNAVLLLDEADVYVRERGDDLHQNAIVGVFLRVLEYQQTLMFLTSNRPDSIDDAICSRCVARLRYKNPPVEDQIRIWRVLADTALINISDAVIRDVVAKHGTLSGRDIKNTLKLAALMTEDSITLQHVEDALVFRPGSNQE